MAGYLLVIWIWDITRALWALPCATAAHRTPGRAERPSAKALLPLINKRAPSESRELDAEPGLVHLPWLLECHRPEKN